MTDQELHKEIMEELTAIKEEQKLMRIKIDPMYEIFSSVNGFNKIAVWILKILAGVGTVLVALYAIIEFFRRLSK